MKYVKKPVVIDAIQYLDKADLTNLKNWVETFEVEFRTYFNADANTDELSVNTLEGTMKVNIGDYIIRGIKGEFYPCKSDIFELTYDKILGENLPEIYNQFPKFKIENTSLADRIAGKIDEKGNPVDLNELMKKWMPDVKKENNLQNEFLSLRIAGIIDELGNEIVKNESIELTMEEISETHVVEEPNYYDKKSTTKKGKKQPKNKK